MNDIVCSVSVAIQLLMCSDLNKHFSKLLHKPGVNSCPDFLQDMYEEVYRNFDERVYPIEVSLKGLSELFQSKCVQLHPIPLPI